MFDAWYKVAYNWCPPEKPSGDEWAAHYESCKSAWDDGRNLLLAQLVFRVAAVRNAWKKNKTGDKSERQTVVLVLGELMVQLSELET